MLYSRFTHRALRLQNGKVLVCGGWDGGKTNLYTTEIYNPQNQSFSQGPDMNEGRSNHTATLLNDGRVLICGGFNGIVDVNSVDIYNPATNEITPASPMIAPRSSHTATLLQDGRVLVCAGFNPDYGFQMNDSEIYNPADNTWIEVEPIPYARDNHAATLLSNGKVLVAGGREFNQNLNVFQGISSVQSFDPETNAWTELESLSQGQSYLNVHAMVSDDADFDYLIIPGATNYSGFEVDLSFSDSEFLSINASNMELEYLNGQELVPGRYRYASCPRFLYGGMNDILVCGGDPGLLGTAVLYQNVSTNLEEEQGLNMKVYPNPVDNQLFFSSTVPFYHVEIYTITGKLLYSESYSDVENDSMIDLENCASGLYLIEIQTAKRKFSRIFAKK
jgi:hypothetical protein